MPGDGKEDDKTAKGDATSPAVISQQTGEQVRDDSAELAKAQKKLVVLKSQKKGDDGADEGQGDDDDAGSPAAQPVAAQPGDAADGEGDDDDAAAKPGDAAAKPGDASSVADDGGEVSPTAPVDIDGDDAPLDDKVDTDGDGNGANMGNGQGVPTAPAAAKPVASSAKPANADARSNMMYQNDPETRQIDIVLKAQAEQRRLNRQKQEEKDRKEFAEAMKINGNYQKKLSEITHLSDPDKSTDFQVTITYDQNTKEDKHVAILFKNFEIIKVKLPKIARPPAGSRRELSLASTHIQPITYTLMNCLLECYKVIEKKVTFNSVGFVFRKIEGSQLTDDEKQKIVDILSSLNGTTTNPYAYYLSNITVFRHAEDKNFFTEIKKSDFSKKIELDYLIQFLFYFKFRINAFAGVEYPVQKSYFGADGDTTLINALQKLRIFPNKSPLYPTTDERLKSASLAKSRARGLHVTGDGDDIAQGGKPQTRKSKLRRRKTERRNSKRGKKINP